MKPKNLTFDQTLALVEPIALAFAARGEERVSMDAVFEEARAKHRQPLSNTIKPQIARRLVELHQHLDPLIERKPLGRGGKHAAPSDFALVADWIVEQGGAVVSVTGTVGGNPFVVTSKTVAEVAKRIREAPRPRKKSAKRK